MHPASKSFLGGLDRHQHFYPCIYDLGLIKWWDMGGHLALLDSHRLKTISENPLRIFLQSIHSLLIGCMDRGSEFYIDNKQVFTLGQTILY